jgi:uncharacterized protein with HEPN domain
MNDRIKKYLVDILSCIDFIEIETKSISGYMQYHENKLLRAAIERQVEIIGEALNQALKINPDLPITNKLRIVGVRNRIIHAYDAVDDVLL